MTAVRIRARRPRVTILAVLALVIAAGGGTASAAPEGSTFFADLPTGFADPSDGTSFIAGTAGDGAVDGDGDRVAFTSSSDGLSDRDDDAVSNVYVRDRATGETILVSVGHDGSPADGSSSGARIDDAGRLVVFASGARNLVPDAPVRGVYVRDLESGTTTLVSRASGPSGPAAEWADQPAISGTGLYVAFVTEDALDAADTNGERDVYARYLGPQATTELVSRASGDGAAGNGESSDPSVEGFAVAFASSATNLVAGVTDTNGATDVFKRTLALSPGGPKVTSLVSARDGLPSTTGNWSSSGPVISAGGTLVAFNTRATDIDAEVTDTNGASDVVLRRLSTGQTELVSRASGPAGALSTGSAHTPAIATVGSRILIAFTSTGNDLVPGAVGSISRPYLRTLDGAQTTTTLLARGPAPENAPADGASFDVGLDATARYAVFTTEAGNLGFATGDHDDAVLHDRTTGSTEPVSVPTGGGLLPERINSSTPAADQALSADGRYVLFSSGSDRLFDDRVTHAFRRDLVTGETTVVDRADGADGAVSPKGANAGSISADGGRVAFTTISRLDPVADTNDHLDVYVRDLATDRTILVSRETGATGLVGTGHSSDPAISADGRRVAFLSAAPNLGAGVDDGRVLVRDLESATTILVSRADGADGAPADARAFAVSIDGDGSRVAFVSQATNLDRPAKTDGFPAAFVRDLDAGTTKVVRYGDGDTAVATYRAEISDDGRSVAYEQVAAAASSDEGDMDVYVKDLDTGTSILASRLDGPQGAETDGFTSLRGLSGDGRAVLFASTAPNLVPTEGTDQLYLRRLDAGSTTLVSRADGANGAPTTSLGFVASSDADGSCVAFASRGAPVAGPGISPDFQRVAVRAVRGECPTVPPTDGTAGASASGGTGTATGGGSTLTDPAPVLSGLTLSRRTFRVGPKATALSAARRTPAGTTIRFRLSETARVTLTVQRVLAGRRVGRTCRAATPRLRTRKPCTRHVRRGALVRNARAGRTSVPFTGRIGRRALATGRYRIAARAVDATGNRSTVRTTRFTIRRR